MLTGKNKSLDSEKVFDDIRARILEKIFLLMWNTYTLRLRDVYTYPDSFVSANILLRIQKFTRPHVSRFVAFSKVSTLETVFKSLRLRVQGCVFAGYVWTLKPVFHFTRIVVKRSVFFLFHEHWCRTNDIDTKENATVRYDTFEVENKRIRIRVDVASLSCNDLNKFKELCDVPTSLGRFNVKYKGQNWSFRNR